jgi:hypothetical protein
MRRKVSVRASSIDLKDGIYVLLKIERPSGKKPGGLSMIHK